MAVVRGLVSWLLGVTNRFPIAARPGLFIVLLVLIIWALTRARRPIYNATLRLSCLGVDAAVGLLLLPEFAFTRAQRANGRAPGAVVLASSRVAEKVLDGAAGTYEAHPFVGIKKRPPIILIVLLIAASVADYYLLHMAHPNAASKFARNVWNAWVQFTKWTQGR